MEYWRCLEKIDWTENRETGRVEEKWEGLFGDIEGVEITILKNKSVIYKVYTE